MSWSWCVLRRARGAEQGGGGRRSGCGCVGGYAWALCLARLRSKLQAVRALYTPADRPFQNVHAILAQHRDGEGRIGQTPVEAAAAGHVQVECGSPAASCVRSFSVCRVTKSSGIASSFRPEDGWGTPAARNVSISGKNFKIRSTRPRNAFTFSALGKASQAFASLKVSFAKPRLRCGTSVCVPFYPRRSRSSQSRFQSSSSRPLTHAILERRTASFTIMAFDIAP